LHADRWQPEPGLYQVALAQALLGVGADPVAADGEAVGHG
jgi:hypothetical protein